ncbi:NAD(P)H-hydrate epimerase [Allofournierella sp.]|uniref:NAD(P)H-hydrate epimerase n=1 Tax=Allofournierella sp. TaxID=1940256 RepID=UPI003AF1DA8A
MEVTAAQMRKIEERAAENGLTTLEMMENAGAAAAVRLMGEAPGPVARAVVFCGKGNNGGDGFVAARYLVDAGVEVKAVLAEGEPATPDAAANKKVSAGAGVEVWRLEELCPEQLEFIRTADVVIDALYGTGFGGALRPAGARAAALMNAARGFKLALDLPSGVEADTGAVAKGAVKADLTVAFHAPKPCHRLAPGQCGRVLVADIGIGQ